MSAISFLDAMRKWQRERMLLKYKQDNANNTDSIDGQLGRENLQTIDFVDQSNRIDME